MHFRPTSISGVAEIAIEWHRDDRGGFGRTFCSREFAERGLNSSLHQCSLSMNRRCGTVRGLHLQRRPHAEAKLVQCVAGRIFDVAVDLRPGSPTYGRYHAVELSRDNGRLLYIPEGCAHGFQTLEDDTAVLYYISQPYAPSAAAGIRWDDPSVGVPWPLADIAILSERDRALPRLVEWDGAN
jgi:dTDP-4-dehydrorhamnose 3,5-epimerase